MSILSHIGIGLLGFALAIYLVKIGSPKMMLIIQSNWTQEAIERWQKERK
jgi:hypothetical protein